MAINISQTKGGDQIHYCITARDFLQGIESSDEQAEASLNTVFQSVRGSKQFWYLRHLDVLYLIRE